LSLRDTAVLVSGAGPTGLVLAAGLAQQGVPVEVVDKAGSPATTSRALGLHPRGSEVLDRVGALGDLPQRAIRMRSMTLRGGGGSEVRLDMDHGRAGYRRALILSQAIIEGQLRERLAELGVPIHWGSELVDAEQDEHGVTATVRAGDGDDKVRAGWLVGCDGAHSAVRKLAGIDFPGEKLVDSTLLADLRADWPLERTGSTAALGEHGMIAAMPLPGGSWRLFAPAPQLSAQAGRDEILREVREVVRGALDLPAESIQDVQWLSVFRIHRRLATTFRRGRMLLAGDAAHIHSPTGGQGMNTGIGDAENLAWKLALVVRGRAGEPLLETYEAERRPLVETVLRSTTAATRVLFAGQRSFLRDRVAFPLMRRPRLQRELWWRASQLGVNYRRGPLADRDRGPGPRSGDRVPNIDCLRPDGTSAVLHDHLGDRWAMLGPPGPADEEVVRRLGHDVVVLRHPDPRMRENLLVRPDGHVAWRGRTGVARWLDAALRGGSG
jgi:4,5-epoxidase